MCMNALKYNLMGMNYTTDLFGRSVSSSAGSTPCQDSIPIELKGAKPTTHRAIYGYTFLGRWLCAQLPGWLSVPKKHCRFDCTAYPLGESCGNTESFGL